MPIYRVHPTGGRLYVSQPGERRIIRLTPAWMLEVKPGDMLRPLCDWNTTTGDRRRRLLPETKVVAVHRAQAQHGLLFEVRSCGGDLMRLSAGWFVGPVPRKGL